MNSLYPDRYNFLSEELSGGHVQAREILRGLCRGGNYQVLDVLEYENIRGLEILILFKKCNKDLEKMAKAVGTGVGRIILEE